MIKIKISSSKNILKEDLDNPQPNKKVVTRPNQDANGWVHNPVIATQNDTDQKLLKRLTTSETDNPVIKAFMKAGYVPVIGSKLNPVLYGTGEQGIVIEVAKDGKRYAGKAATLRNAYGHNPLIEKEVRTKIEKLRHSLPPEVSKHIVKTHAIFNDKSNIYYIMDIVRPMKQQEADALYQGLTAAGPTKNVQFPKGWSQERDPHKQFMVRGDRPKEIEFRNSYKDYSDDLQNKTGFEKQTSFIKAMQYINDNHDIEYSDLHHKNVMMNPITNDYVATDIGLFYLRKKQNKPITKEKTKTAATRPEPIREQLLQEMSIKDVMVSLRSKAVKKTIYQYELLYDKEQSFDRTKEKLSMEDTIEETVNRIEAYIYAGIPNDLNDNQKGLSAAWLRKFFLGSYEIFRKYRYQSTKSNIAPINHNLELYFKVHRFVKPEERDLMKIVDSVELSLAVEAAMPIYLAYQEKKEYADASKGTEVIYEDDKWKIFIPHNKGASCELGKGTSWCTAAPGLDYYSEYHKQDDPLFIVWQKPRTSGEKEIIRDNPQKGEAYNKYQFHYGTKQFMDSSDEPLFQAIDGNEILKEVHNILAKTVGERFPFLHEIIETEYGLSIPETYQTAEQEGSDSSLRNIVYKDLSTGISSNSEDTPNINIQQYQEGDIIDISWYTPGHWPKGNLWGPEGNNDFRDELDAIQSRNAGPAIIRIEIRHSPNKIILRTIKWGKGGKAIGYWEADRPNNTPKIYNNDAEKNWLANYSDQFRKEIQPRPTEWAIEQLRKYLPQDIQEYYAAIKHYDEKFSKEPLKENKILLNEITVEQAKAIIFSKATARRILGLRWEFHAPGNNVDEQSVLKQSNPEYVDYLWEFIEGVLPKDLTEEQKALSIIWIKNQALESFNKFQHYPLKRTGINNMRQKIERFFQMQSFIEPREMRDINNVKNVDHIMNLVLDAQPKYQAYLEKQQNADASQGTEKIFENEEWEIYIAHNRGAACQLGKGTDWCTAAPGLDYFKEYSKPNDPLFIFVSKWHTKTTRPDVAQKFQFHYGTQSFMDKSDSPVTRGTFRQLHSLLINIPGMLERYPIIGTLEKNFAHPPD